MNGGQESAVDEAGMVELGAAFNMTDNSVNIYQEICQKTKLVINNAVDSVEYLGPARFKQFGCKRVDPMRSAVIV